MASTRDNEITQILNDLSGTDQDAVAKLLPLVYDELHALSEAYLRRERPDHTLQATALVHEAYIRLTERGTVQWQGRAHFFRAAAKTMRRILINHAHAHKAQKRGGGARGISLEEATVALPQGDVDLIEVDEALTRLAGIDAQKARLVELRFFGGCTIAEAAEALGVSTATVERDWRFARAWLRCELDETDS